jgi:hypothetical protein
MLQGLLALNMLQGLLALKVPAMLEHAGPPGHAPEHPRPAHRARRLAARPRGPARGRGARGLALRRVQPRPRADPRRQRHEVGRDGDSLSRRRDGRAHARVAHAPGAPGRAEEASGARGRAGARGGAAVRAQTRRHRRRACTRPWCKRRRAAPRTERARAPAGARVRRHEPEPSVGPARVRPDEPERPAAAAPMPPRPGAEPNEPEAPAGSARVRPYQPRRLRGSPPARPQSPPNGPRLARGWHQDRGRRTARWVGSLSRAGKPGRRRD